MATRVLATEDLLNLVDIKIVIQIELNPRVIAQHAETNCVLSANKLLDGIDANVEVIEQQIVIGTIAAVLSAQDVGMSWSGWRSRLLTCLTGNRRDDKTDDKKTWNQMFAGRRLKHCRYFTRKRLGVRSPLVAGDFSL